MKKSLIALSVLAATSAFAGGSNPAATVAVAGNGVGDLLLAPMFMTAGGWNTELKVVNTSPTLSTVAKVVFYENFRSTEVLDFFIFLSPGDEWNGVVACVASGSNPCASVTMTSSDDSVLATSAAFATPAAPAIYAFSNPASLGYVGVFEEAAWSLGSSPLAKSVVKARHDLDNASGVTYLETDTKNILAGNVRLTNTLNGAASTLPMTAWENYDNRNPLTLGGLTVFGGDVGSPSYTTTAQLEQTFWNNNWVVPYDHSQGTTVGSVTFPTRRTYDGILHGAGIGLYPFNNVTKVPVQGNVTMRDMQENTILAQGQVTSPLPATVRPAFAEGGYFLLKPGQTQATDLDQTGQLSALGTGSFNSGWAQFNLDGFAGSNVAPSPTATPIVGAPAVVTQFNWNTSTGALKSEWWYSQYDYTTTK